ncbi:TIGR03619 family F420-dependent LLM class oxidoreductase [soil metagenome]|jgi:probable F420-dependent oxidoreductase
MKMGFAVPQSGSWATPDNQAEVARTAEALGYHEVWTFQRLLYAAESSDPRWSPVYRSVHDPLITLSYVAAHTTRVRLGVAVLNLPWYAPLVLAKQLTTLDVVSGGRLDVGLGLGWAAEEYAAAGVAMAGRGRRADEFIACLQAVWSEGVVEHHGEFFDVPASHVEPKPVQSPHPPLLLGGFAPAALARAGRLTDGWISSARADVTALGTAVAAVRRAAEEAGRDPDALRFVCRGSIRLRPAGQPDRTPLSGSIEEIRRDFADLEEQGMTELFVDLNFDPDIGSVEVDPAVSMERAREALEGFAPWAGR